jgi:hypothetical protein
MRRCVLLVCLLLCGAAGAALAQDGKTLPSRVDLRPDFESKGLVCHAQGDRDTCSLFALTALAEFEAGRGEGGRRPSLSEEFAIWAATKATGKTHDQAMFYEATRGLNVLGICRDDLMPYRAKPNAAEKPSPRALADAKTRSERWRVHWIRRWNVSRPLSDGELSGIKQALANHHPVACGMRWPN